MGQVRLHGAMPGFRLASGGQDGGEGSEQCWRAGEGSSVSNWEGGARVGFGAGCKEGETKVTAVRRPLPGWKTFWEGRQGQGQVRAR